MNRPWRETLWYRLPAAVGRKRVAWTLATLAVLLIGAPSIFLIVRAHTLVPFVVRQTMAYLVGDPFWAQALETMQPERRAALPSRLQGVLAQVLVPFGLLGVVVAVSTGILLLLFSRLLAVSLGAASLRAAPARSPSPWKEGVLVFFIGMAAHLPTLRQSFNTDEAAAAMHTLNHWWSWADTRGGWAVHLGGELLARIGMTVFGVSDWGARVPAAICSSVGLALTYLWVYRLRGRVAAVLTAGLICALPLWAEQACLARGYGMLFLAGALAIPALWEILDGVTEGGESRTLAALLVANALGFLAHFFFLFFSAGVISLLAARAWRARDPVAAAGAAWSAVGLLPAGLLYVPGIPATLFQTKTGGSLSRSVVLLRFVEALGFDLPGPGRWIIFGCVLCLCVWGMTLLTSERRRVAVLVLSGLVAPFLLRPVFFYPRFFIHLLPLSYLVVLPFARLLRSWRQAAGVAVAMWLIGRPWDHPPTVDIRAGIEGLRRLALPGETAYLQRFFVAGRFYSRDFEVKPVDLERGFPSRARILLAGHDWHDPVPAFPGFHIVARFPGREVEMLTYQTDADRR